jgi:hypothetical protein
MDIKIWTGEEWIQANYPGSDLSELLIPAKLVANWLDAFYSTGEAYCTAHLQVYKRVQVLEEMIVKERAEAELRISALIEKLGKR